MVLCPVSPLAKVHSTAVLALRNGKTFKVGGGGGGGLNHPQLPIKFRP